MADYILGSGDLYLVVADAIPEDETFETAGNKIGHISGGATLSYGSETYEVVDDYNQVLGRSITKEEVTFKTGILTWDLAVLNKVIASSTYTAGTGEAPDTIKIGGQSSSGIQKVCVRFIHTTADSKKLKVTLIGNNEAGFELNFMKDKESIIDAEFKALSQADGTLVEITLEK